MSEEHNFENELGNLLSNSGSPVQNAAQPATPPPPGPATPVQADRPKEKQLSQAEIDALLARMLGG